MTIDKLHITQSIIIVVLLLLLFWLNSPTVPNIAVGPKDVIKTETLYVASPLPAITVTPQKPKTVIISKTADSTARAKAEKQKIITGVAITEQGVMVHALDSRSIQMNYQSVPIHFGKVEKIAINDTGSFEVIYKDEKKLKRKQQLKNAVFIATGATLFIAGAIFGNKLNDGR